jgi:hypothetical protein
MTFFKLALLSLFIFGCAHKKVHRHPAQVSSIDQKIFEVEKNLEELQALKNDKNAVYMDFKDSGLDSSKRRYDVYAQIFSNDPQGIERVELIINEKVVKEIKPKWIDSNLFIQEKFMMKLPIHSTKFRFSFAEGGVKEVELVCTRVDKCL